MQLEIEEAALQEGEGRRASKERLETLRKELADLRAQADAMTRPVGGRDGNAIQKLQALRAGDRGAAPRDRARRSAATTSTARPSCAHGKLPQLEQRLRRRGGAAGAKPRAVRRLLREEVTEEEIAEVVAALDRHPGRRRLVEGEREKLLRLDESPPPARHRPGRGGAAGAPTRSSARAPGIKDPRRPIGSFIFLGPTGVGKTELAQGARRGAVRLRDNMVRARHVGVPWRSTPVSRLIGAPPGYVGYEEGGQLTEAVRRKPYSVVLFDEIEKAHPDVFNVLLQLLDDGRLTDAQGRTVDFTNTVVIMTSNIGSPSPAGRSERPWRDRRGGARARHGASCASHFRPEFLNRVDDIVLFKLLTLAEIERIAELQMDAVRRRLADRRIASSSPTRHATTSPSTPMTRSTARAPLRRYIQREVETRIGRALPARDIRDGATIRPGRSRRRAPRGQLDRLPTSRRGGLLRPLWPNARGSRVHDETEVSRA